MPETTPVTEAPPAEQETPVQAEPQSDIAGPPHDTEAPPPKLIPEDEAKRRESAVAAAARREAEAKAAEAEKQAADLQKRLDAIEAERKQAERAQMTEAQRIAAEAADDKAEAERLRAELAKTQAIASELTKQQRVAQLQAASKTVAPGLPPSLYQAQFEALAARPDYDLDSAVAEIARWGSELTASLEAAGIKPKPTSVGSPGSPPAEPRGDTDAELEDLIARADAGDPEAIKGLETRFGRRR